MTYRTRIRYADSQKTLGSIPTTGSDQPRLNMAIVKHHSGRRIMRSGYRLRLLWIVVIALMSGSLLPAAANDVPPILSAQMAMDIALKLAGEATHSHTYSTQAIRFEPSTREWVVDIEASVGSNSTKRFVATVNESTGLACLQLTPTVGCVVQANIHQTVVEAQAKAEAEVIARKYPAPDLQQMAEVLIRHQCGAEQSPKGGAIRSRYFVSLPSPDAKGFVDLSPEIMASLKRDGIETYPGGAWKQGGASVSFDLQFSVGLPVRRSDGNYDVPYGYYCGPLCAGWFTAVMKHDAAGWHVVSTVMNAIS
jgi:hypothetical protein